jgi:hypothetical protein
MLRLLVATRARAQKTCCRHPAAVLRQDGQPRARGSGGAGAFSVARRRLRRLGPPQGIAAGTAPAS